MRDLAFRGFLLVTLLFSGAYAKVYDCFLFFNELDILEIRLNELYDHVDHFVLLESCESFRGLDKPYYFEKNKERFQQFADKIIHIKLDQRIETKSPWHRERFQRDALLMGLEGAAPSDIVMISDVDEIPPKESISTFEKHLRGRPLFGFYHWMYRYFLNREVKELSGKWPGVFVCRYSYLERASPDRIRKSIQFETGLFRIQGGWHFSSMGGFESVVEKITNFSHWREVKEISFEKWRREVDQLVKVPIDGAFPEFVQNNVDYFFKKGLIDR